MIKEHSFGAIVFRKEGNKIIYLLLYRKASGKYDELWDFPRGLIEKDEDPKDVAKREVEEESGITSIKFLEGFEETINWFYKLDGQMRYKEATYFLGETKTKEVKLSFEHDNFKWCEYEEAMKTISKNNIKTVLTKANEFLTGGLNKFM